VPKFPLASLAPCGRGYSSELTWTQTAFTQAAYYEFAVSFLAQPELHLFESNIDSFAADVDVDALSDSLNNGSLPDARTSGSQANLLWLLAHFIVLQKNRKQLVLHSHSLRVLSSLLSALSLQIRVAFAAAGLKASTEIEDLDDISEPQPGLPPYVSDKLTSLTDRDEISGLLEKFTA